MLCAATPSLESVPHLQHYLRDAASHKFPFLRLLPLLGLFPKFKPQGGGRGGAERTVWWIEEGGLSVASYDLCLELLPRVAARPPPARVHPSHLCPQLP